jgi:hypothetical protein
MSLMGGGHHPSTGNLQPIPPTPKNDPTKRPEQTKTPSSDGQSQDSEHLRLSIPTKHSPASQPPHPLPDKPQHIWWQKQEAQFCWIHAHNMLLQTEHLNPHAVVRSLQAEVQDPHCVGKNNMLMSFGPRGPFGSMAINRYLHKHTPNTPVYYKALNSSPDTYPQGLTKTQLLQLLPRNQRHLPGLRPTSTWEEQDT